MSTLKRTFAPLSVALVLGASSLPAFGKDAPPAGTFQVDAAHSKVGFEVPHLVISTVDGRFTKFDGVVDLGADFAKSKVTLDVDVSSIDTGVGKRDEHLRSPDFFDASKHPKMTFKSTKVEGNADAFKLTGDLSIHGVTKPVTFEGQYLGTVGDGYGNQKVAFKARTKIRRQDFGLTWSNVVEAGPVVGDDVTIELVVQAGRPAAKK